MIIFAMSVNPDNGQVVYSGNIGQDAALRLLTDFVISKRAEAILRQKNEKKEEAKSEQETGK